MGPTRKEQRIPAVIPVRLSSINEEGESLSCLSHTLNVSRRGARLAGVSIALRMGTIVRVTRGRAVANFRVTWLGPHEKNNQRQVGVECLEMVGNFWGLEELHPVSADAERDGVQRRIKSKP